MQSQKLENLLNQALNATESERERSQELNVGYNPCGPGVGVELSNIPVIWR